MKIKITKSEKNVEGDFEEGFVKPFGTSAHFTTKRKYLGMKAGLVIPSDAVYTWILSENERKKIVEVCREQLEKEIGKMKPHKAQAIKNIQMKEFTMNDLNLIDELMKNSGKEAKLLNKFRRMYQR